MDEASHELVPHKGATPPAYRLLAEQRIGLALVLTGSLLVLCATLPSRLLVQPALPVTRLPESQLEFRIDLNHATWAELVQLPGIGPSLAERILEDRERRGVFSDGANLGRVRGIGPQILERVLPFIAVSGSERD